MRLRHLLVPLLAAATVTAGPVPARAQAATATASGVVTASADGAPVAELCVEVLGPVFESTSTAPDGTWRLDGLPPGDYVVGFGTCGELVPGLLPEYFQDAPDFDDAELVPLSAGQARPGVDAALEPAASISGTVVGDDDGAALPGVCVLALSDDGRGFGFAETGSDGGYAVEGLPAGDYTVLLFDCQDPFLHRDEAYDDVQLQESVDGQGVTPVRVGAGEAREGVDAGLELGGALRGRVTGSHHGRPIDLVCVGLQEAGRDGPSALAFTGVAPGLEGALPRGTYVLGGLRPGPYDLVQGEQLCGDDGYLPPADGAARQQVVQGEVTPVTDLVLTPQPSTSTVCFDADESSSRFPDVDPANVHAGAVDCAADYDVARGGADGSYRPGAPVLRDQMAGFVARTMTAAGAELPLDPPDAFRDDDASVHALAIDQLAALGVVSGRADGRYLPSEPVTRAQMATFLVGAYEQAAGFDLLVAPDAFRDDTGDVHEPRIDQAAAAGLTAGSGAGYGPALPVRRDQMATFVARLLDRLSRDTVLADVADGGDGSGVFAQQSAAGSRRAGSDADVRRSAVLAAG